MWQRIKLLGNKEEKQQLADIWSPITPTVRQRHPSKKPGEALPRCISNIMTHTVWWRKQKHGVERCLVLLVICQIFCGSSFINGRICCLLSSEDVSLCSETALELVWFPVERCHTFSVAVLFYGNLLSCPYPHRLQPPTQNHSADVMTHNCLLGL